MNLDDAIKKHLDWKIKFYTAISKQEQMDVSLIVRDDCCELGKWLHGEGKIQCSGLESYLPILSKHVAFHLEAGKVAAAINAKKYTEAEAMLGSSSAFAAISKEIGLALIHLKNEVN
jgi:methyl-accepting chemotaxis protein